MYGLVREEGSLGSNPGSKDIARHLYTRMFSGKVVIVADRPTVLIGTLRRQWFKLYRRTSRELSSTLDGGRIFELTKLRTRMLTMRFTIRWPDDLPADVYIVTTEQLLQWAPECRTVYVTCDIELEDLHRITAMMPQGSLVVLCKFN